MVEADVEKLLAKYGVTGMVAAIIMIIFGVLVILIPALIAYLIGAYLIIVGLINLIQYLQTTQAQQQQRPPMARPVDRTRRAR
jgi:uncharacterized membrane protein HdeD (DUF308 family)